MKIRPPSPHAIRSLRPSAPTLPSTKSTHNTADGTGVQSLRTLIAELETLVRNSCRKPGATDQPQTFEILTTQTPLHRRASELLEAIAAWSETKLA